MLKVGSKLLALVIAFESINNSCALSNVSCCTLYLMYSRGNHYFVILLTLLNWYECCLNYSLFLLIKNYFHDDNYSLIDTEVEIQVSSFIVIIQLVNYCSETLTHWLFKRNFLCWLVQQCFIISLAFPCTSSTL